MGCYTLGFQEIDRTQAVAVGGKGANLGELSRIEWITVADGFCVTTHAFQRILAQVPTVNNLLTQLSSLKAEDRDAIRTLSAEIRTTVEAAAIPEDLGSAITLSLTQLGATGAYAVRSSATLEDSPGASFAGQHDSYLNVTGCAELLRRISRCWASLFSERAVTYRLRNGIDHRQVQMAVVVQRMVFPHAAGILFTADPITSNRKVASVEASFGLGEAIVSGQVDSDRYRVQDGEIRARTIANKRVEIHALADGGTHEQAIDPRDQERPALTDAQVLRLVALGRRIETHFKHPQDIEWCLVDDVFVIVQSRPITTLFPIPQVGERGNHVYVSVGHQQMMTDPMKPLGRSVWQLTALVPMHEAGGRLFVDVTARLASPTRRAAVLAALGSSDPLIRDALQTVLDRGDFIPAARDEPAHVWAPVTAPASIKTDPRIPIELIEANRASVATLRREIAAKSGPPLFAFILADIEELKRLLVDPRSHQVFMTAIDASAWINEHLREWLGETNAADVLTQSVPNNVTSEMGLALLDVADTIRPYPKVVAFLENVEEPNFLAQLDQLEGGRGARDAIGHYLERYGMRCVGEIDLTRPRWSERPSTLIPLILANVKNFEPHAGKRRFAQGLKEARQKEEELLTRLRALPDGESKAQETKQMIDRVRTFIGYREYPKYGIVSRYLVYKQSLMREAARLVQSRVLRAKEDIFYLTFQEFHDVARTNEVDDELVRRRKGEFRSYQALTPPRVLTSDGEAIAGAYQRDALPAGALIGLAVSAGIVEGRARVILDIEQAELEPGDILVTTYTDPSWATMFVAIKGLVTEVGGLMTHGAVVAREYGLPAVVGVEHATRLIRDGQRIRVHGTDGYVEVLTDAL